MFYRSGWLRCDVFICVVSICVVFCSGLMLGVCVYYIILYSSLPSLPSPIPILSFCSSSVLLFLYNTLIPSPLPIPPSSISFFLSFPPLPIFILYLSGVTYTYLYYSSIPPILLFQSLPDKISISKMNTSIYL
jgi:hypothetical protein